MTHKKLHEELHKDLHELEYADLKGAIDCLSEAPLAFLLEVIGDEQYSQRLRIEASKVALPLVYGPPTHPPVTSDDDPRLVEVMAKLGITGRN